MSAVNYRFGPFVLDRTAYRLSRAEAAIDVSPKSFDLLVLFCSRPGELVTKDDMLAALWPGIAVTDNALTQVVSELRQALGDDSSAPTYVQTVPRRGYRFIATVESLEPKPAHAETDEGAEPRRRPRAEGSRTIVVPDFINVTNDDEVKWLAAGIAETVTNDLRAVAGVRVIDRGLLVRPKVGGGTPPSSGPATADPSGALAAARAAGLDLVVVGSFQRSGDRLRIMARVLDVQMGESVATAKADGTLAEVFQLQDALVTQLASALQLTVTPAAAARISARETSSLDAYRALTEGRLKLETLELSDVPGALADFERAIALDPQYALAHVGIAHAQFWRFQASRARPRPDRDALAAALAHARKAVEIDPELAEGHAALALFLAAADRTREAVLAGRVAVGLEPGNWRHQFRLGMAEWGGARLACLEAVVAQFPAFAYAHFGIGMVLVARGELEAAEAALARGVNNQMSGAGAGRFPGRGLHWLLGLVRLAGGRPDAAVSLFEAELASPSRGMHAEEFVMDGYDGLGFARLAAGDHAGGAAMFEKALEHVAGHARSLIGLAECAQRSGDGARAATLLGQAEEAIEELTRSGRHTEAGMSRAYWLIASKRPPAEAVEQLTTLLQQAPPGPAGWTVPIEPWLAPLRKSPQFAPVLARVAERAR